MKQYIHIHNNHEVLSPSYVKKGGGGVVFGCLIYEMCFIIEVYYLNNV